MFHRIKQLLAGVLLAAMLVGCTQSVDENDPQALLSRLTVELQQGIVWGEYEPGFDDSLGGTPLLQNGKQCGGIDLIERYTAQFDQNGNSVQVECFTDEIVLDQFENLPSPCPCVTARYTAPDGSTRWCAFWVPQQGKPLYLLWLDASICDYDTLQGLAMSVDIKA